MKYRLVLLLGLTISVSASAVEITVGGLAQTNNKDYKGMSIKTSDGKSTVDLTMKDGTTQQLTIPNYPLMNAANDFCSMYRFGGRGDELRDLLIRQAQGKSITPEETTLLTALAADSKIYDDNVKLTQPVCALPSPSGISVSTSMGMTPTPCAKLSAAELAAAPHIEQDKNMRMGISVADASYRFKIPKEERKKLAPPELRAGY